jgi:Tol biopolymer transport system component
MKRCPECRKDYLDDSLLYCLDDGMALVQGSVTDEPATAILSGDQVLDEGLTKPLKTDGTRSRSRSRSITFSVPTFLSRDRLPWIVAVALGLTAVVFAYGYFNRSASGTSRAERLAFVAPVGLSFDDVKSDFVVISPDGQKIAFSATGADGKSMLYVRDLDSAEAKVLPGSENPLAAFWSPDSKSVAYGSNGKLKRSELSGGNAQVLCDAARLVAGSWSKDGVIVFAPDYRTALVQVPAKGGEARTINIQSENIDHERHNNPVFMPDGRHFLFDRTIGNPNDGANLQRLGLWAGSLDSPEIKQVTSEAGGVAYVPEGWLIFNRNDTFVAQAFDAVKLTLSGEPIQITGGQATPLGGTGRRFSVSDDGVLVWQASWEREYQLTWFDREGKQIGVASAPETVTTGQDPHISPDGKRLLIKRSQPLQTLWVIDLEKNAPLRITSDFGQIPIWSPDGSTIAYSSNGGLTVKPANGLGNPEVIWPGTNFPYSWSPDGRYIIFHRRGVKSRMDMYAVSMSGERKESLLLNSPFDEQAPQISPNGKWLAYSADDTGNYEIYIQAFEDGKLGPDRKIISTTGGFMPVWRKDGSELFFIARDGQMMVSSVKAGGNTFEFSTPKALFKTRMLGLGGGNNHEFDVSPDGQRFLIGTLVGDSKAQPPTVILNWSALIKK